MALKDQLKRARLQAGLAQRELGEAVGLSQGHISNIESGRRETGLDVIDRWIAACGCQLHLEVGDTALKPEDRELVERFTVVAPLLTGDARKAIMAMVAALEPEGD